MTVVASMPTLASVIQKVDLTGCAFFFKTGQDDENTTGFKYKFENIQGFKC